MPRLAAIGAAGGIWSRFLGLGFALVLSFSFAGQAAAQVVTFTKSDKAESGVQVDGSGTLTPRKVVTTPPPKKAPSTERGSTISYADWIEFAETGETLIQNRRSNARRLESLRDELVAWREAFLSAQDANAQRIKTIKDQIAALGPTPADAASEAVEIKSRRQELDGQLSRAQAPVIAAEEAYSRADGMIREIDRELRERQTDALLKLWPTPINPIIWSEAMVAGRDLLIRALDEVTLNWANPTKRAEFQGVLPVSIFLFAFGFTLFRYGRRWIEGLVTKLRQKSAARWSNVWAFIASFVGLGVPILGVGMVLGGLGISGLAGQTWDGILAGVGNLLQITIIAGWLGYRLFPTGPVRGIVALPAERRIEARYLTTLLGIVAGTEEMRATVFDSRGYSDGALSVMTYPGLMITCLLLFRFAQLLRQHLSSDQVEIQQGTASALWFLTGFARVAMVISVLAAVMATIGYIPASKLTTYALVYTFALIGTVLILQDFFADVFVAVMGRTEIAAKEGLVPVLVNFMLVLVALPVLAMIWGIRSEELWELWTRFREGITIGSTRISPTSFLVFATIFGIGYAATRTLQRALKTSILPRTSLDVGGQNAVVSGIGYVGLFLAALLAINSAGIDLSGLAIVAGALSVGIGFGLQTIVSNFVSGIILLVERPVSEGDWIEVGTTQGIVKSISVRSTRIQTFDRSDVIVPNSDLITGRVTNWTRFSLTGRLILPVSVPYTSDSRHVEAILTEIAEAQPLAIMNPRPTVSLMGFTADAMTFEIRLILRDVYQQLQVRSEMNHQIATRFAQEQILFSNAHRDYLERQRDAIAVESLAEQESQAHITAVAEGFAAAAPKRSRSLGAINPEEHDG